MVRLELFMMVMALSSAKLPRYLSALELHATLAQRTDPGGEDVALLGLAAAELRRQLEVLSMVKTEATDMAKKLDSWESQAAG